MRNIKLSLWGVLLGLTALWLLADTLLPASMTFRELRGSWVQYTGVIGIGVMSVAMVLAVRSRWLEDLLDGLDKSYRLHKWLGISALITAIVHWAWATGPKYAVALGLIERPQRHGPPSCEALGMIEQLFRDLRGPAEFVGEWAFYATVMLIALALIKRFPYKLFAKTHHWIAIAYLVLAFHAVVLMKASYWTQPVGVVTGLLILAGTVSAVWVLFGMVGRSSKVEGVIETLEAFPSMNVLETVIKLKDGWRGHRGGQFAFVTFDSKEEAHPFTIGSAWNPEDRRITFITKSLGDYTELLHDRLRKGDRVEVEGPYGRFIFNDDNQRQIWIGGGIGITPFIARMKQLARVPHDQVIDLFHTVAGSLHPAAESKLSADVAASRVKLHLLIDDRDGRLTGERLRETVPDWKEASVWFCGPAGFGQALRKDLTANGLSAKDFHQELFNLR